MRGVDVKIRPGLVVGYVMGVGDDVPSGIAQLGATVELLDEEDLASGDLRRFNAIVTGTRAYAVRSDLRTYNHRLLDYVKAGGNLIVLYNTAELDPKKFAPFPGELTAPRRRGVRGGLARRDPRPDESCVPSSKRHYEGGLRRLGGAARHEILVVVGPGVHRADLATWDKGQPPQAGGWLHARYGSGHYTYFAYAFHRQLPYAVPGAYRLLANLLSLDSSAGRP